MVKDVTHTVQLVNPARGESVSHALPSSLGGYICFLQLLYESLQVIEGKSIDRLLCPGR